MRRNSTDIAFCLIHRIVSAIVLLNGFAFDMNLTADEDLIAYVIYSECGPPKNPIVYYLCTYIYHIIYTLYYVIYCVYIYIIYTINIIYRL